MRRYCNLRFTDKNCGFTLLELLVAVAIFAILATLSYGGLNSVLKNRVVTDEQAAQLHQLQIALTIMQRDFQQLTNQTARDEFGDRRSALFVDANSEALIEFTRSGWRNPAGQLRGTQQRVRYLLEEEQLYREYWPHLHRGPETETIRATLLDAVQDVTFNYRDANGGWHDTWPPLTQRTTALPNMVRLNLEFSNDVTLSRDFPIVN